MRTKVYVVVQQSDEPDDSGSYADMMGVFETAEAADQHVRHLTIRAQALEEDFVKFYSVKAVWRGLVPFKVTGDVWVVGQEYEDDDGVHHLHVDSVCQFEDQADARAAQESKYKQRDSEPYMPYRTVWVGR